MRLIDADAMLKRLEAWNTSDKMDKAHYNFTWWRITEQPTAYDVDKVVEELEKELADCGDCYEETGMRAAYIKAIEIVKRGVTCE